MSAYKYLLKALPIAFLVLLAMGGIGFQNADRTEASEWIIEVVDGVSAEDLTSEMRQILGTQVDYLGLVSRIAKLHLIKVHATIRVRSRSIYSLYDLSEIVSITKNATVEMRLRPDDTEYEARQQNMEIIEAPAAWDVTTGGVTPNGDTIVVAVIDEGFQLTHPDLVDNLWVFRDEIADDGLDNDGNGFIDDVNGWDAKNETVITNRQNSHGTGVAGIAGAKGNNDLGVAGVNWNVKILPVDIDAPSTVAAILRAYDYILVQKQLYLSSGGQQGAYIVATNSSFGVDNAMPTEFPAWCNFYNLFGQEGILSVGATTNTNTDVEIEGDLPSTCSSNLLIMVTNTDSEDQVVSAGFGTTSIDLAAPGSGTFTLTNNNSYGPLGGTSSSSPHVAGLIGLIYSIPCTELGDMMINNTQAYISLVKNNILSGVDTLVGLQERTATGGRLNVKNTIERMLESCPVEMPELEYKIVNAYPVPTDNTLTVDYQSPNSEEECISIFNSIGQYMRSYPVTPSNIQGKRLVVDNLNLVAGIYFLRIPCDNPQSDYMIVVQ